MYILTQLFILICNICNFYTKKNLYLSIENSIEYNVPIKFIAREIVFIIFYCLINLIHTQFIEHTY